MENNFAVYKPIQVNTIGNSFNLSTGSTGVFKFETHASSITVGTEGVTIFLNHEDIPNYMKEFSYNFTYNQRKDELYITAIKNLIKKSEIFNLQDRLERRVISKREFNKEIETNPSKYIIDTYYVTDYFDVHVAQSIVNDLDIEITIDEVAEMFSFEVNSFSTALSNLLN